MSLLNQPWRNWLRQRRHPPAFRIDPPAWDHAQRRRLEQLLADWSAPAADADTVTAPDAAAGLDETALAAAATNLWRARRRLERQTDSSSSGRQLRKLLRSTHEELAAAGLVVQDHDGLAFDSGFALEALAFEDDPTVAEERVKETVRPSVYLEGRRIQMGQVIVGHPVGDQTRGE